MVRSQISNVFRMNNPFVLFAGCYRGIWSMFYFANHGIDTIWLYLRISNIPNQSNENTISKHVKGVNKQIFVCGIQDVCCFILNFIQAQRFSVCSKDVTLWKINPDSMLKVKLHKINTSTEHHHVDEILKLLLRTTTTNITTLNMGKIEMNPDR